MDYRNDRDGNKAVVQVPGQPGLLSRRNLDFAAYLKRFHNVLGGAVFTDHRGNELTQKDGFGAAIGMLRAVGVDRGHVFLVGNGGSSAVASHIATDFCKTARLFAVTLHESSVLTCLSNDYGYENAYAYRLQHNASPNDILIAISSSGRSENILNAVDTTHDKGGKVITLSGFGKDNPLRTTGDLNIWLDVPEGDYGLVEVGHLSLLHYIADQLGGQFTE